MFQKDRQMPVFLSFTADQDVGCDLKTTAKVPTDEGLCLLSFYRTNQLEDWGKGAGTWGSGRLDEKCVCVCDGVCAYVVLINQIEMVNFTVWFHLINKLNQSEMFKLPNLFCFVSMILNIYNASWFNFQ